MILQNNKMTNNLSHNNILFYQVSRYNKNKYKKMMGILLVEIDEQDGNILENVGQANVKWFKL